LRVSPYRHAFSPPRSRSPPPSVARFRRRRRRPRRFRSLLHSVRARTIDALPRPQLSSSRTRGWLALHAARRPRLHVSADVLPLCPRGSAHRARVGVQRSIRVPPAASRPAATTARAPANHSPSDPLIAPAAG